MKRTAASLLLVVLLVTIAALPALAQVEEPDPPAEDAPTEETAVAEPAPPPEPPRRFFGAAFVRGNDIESFGVRVEYYRPGTFRAWRLLEELVPSLMIGGDFSYFFPQTFLEGTFSEYSVNFFALNVNTRGNYLDREQLNAYWLFGANIFLVSYTDEEGDVALAYSNAFNAGINLGTGIEFGLGGLTAFGEIKYALSSIDQLVLAGGVRLGF